MNLSELMRVSELLDFYGGMLTDNQVRVARSYIDYNASLGEIADTNGTTRQAVSDVLHRTIAKLEDCEARLGLIAKFHEIIEAVPAVAAKIAGQNRALADVIGQEFVQLFKTLED